MVLTRLRRVIPTERFVEAGALAGALVAAVAIVRRRVSLRHAHHGGQLTDLAILVPGGIVALGIYALMLRIAVPRRPSTAHDPTLLAGQTAVDADGQRQ
jgi:ABC-type spermidine/putrescine transport system permease subunit II